MKQHAGFQIFISHATLDGELANTLQDCIMYALRLKKGDIFCSSDSTSLRMGKTSVEQITEGHRQAKAVVALMTPNSIYRPWVIYEAGGAHFHDTKQLFITVANGATADSLPAPLQWWHVGSLDEPKCVENLCDLLAQALRRKSKSRPLPKTQVEKIVALAKQSLGDWEHVSPALASAALAQSPFNVCNLLNTASPNAAKKEVYMIGQHLHGMTEPNNLFFANYKEKIFAWLRTDKTRRYCIMITDVRYRIGVDPWNLVHGTQFEPHLKQATKVLTRWVKEAKHDGLSLTLKVSKFVPIGATFIDPNTSGGLMVMKPVVYETGSAERPQFILSKQQNEIVFEHYWTSFRKALSKAAELG